MLRLPPGTKDAVQEIVRVTVNFLVLEVSAAPFAQQDTQFGRCTCMAAWA